MNLIESVVARALAEIEACHTAREHALTLARALTRQCANTIRAVHRREFAEAAALLTEAGASARALRESLADHPDLLYAGYSQDALKEYAEAALVYAFLHGDPPPDASSLGVDAAAYLNGMAEAASELRRAILDSLRTGATERGVELLSVMEDVYSLLITVDYPEVVTGGLRRTTDALRAVLERTRGDVTAAIRQDQLIMALERFERRLDGHAAVDPDSVGDAVSPGQAGVP
ncbi:MULTISPECIES: haloacid dehalogenase [Roseiflexus]|jgi:translin|uniref:Translin n=1 Tax=Roseiflexus castenholzii (strain DSM 13941 / HLO8) TaxID=383372 RepID=A7NPF1_ROSCS|nr:MULTISPECIES: haloacid dehalogenase [Roseiflexus]ABU59447.1 Translin [Roseiflexus castenholzii DSM 13941]GIW02535.1 MAG: haloacid dehalogenase [Roseiflexus sp.]